MDTNKKILNSKLCFSGSSDTVIRKRFNALIDKIPKKRLTTVIAGAGYGKSTMAAQAIEYLGLKAVWYRLDKYDRDLATFLRYLITGIQNIFPETLKETLRRIEEAPILKNEYEAVIFVLLSEIEQFVKEDILIVLDDYHNINDSPEIKESLNFFIENTPPQIHLLFVSRTYPDLSLSLFRSRRDILDIREADMAFSASEIYRFYAEIFDLSLEDNSITLLHDKTGGWVSALILFYYALQGKSAAEIEDFLLKINGSYDFISKYLEENIYDKQPSGIKTFLQKTSVLSRIKVSFCNKLLQTDKSEAILKKLEDNHLFTFPVDESREMYYFHNLFQDFLQMKLHQELSSREITSLHENIAILMEEEGEQEEALNHYLLGEQYESACRLLISIGQKLIFQGRAQQIKSYIDILPDRYLDSHPWIFYLRGQLHMLSSDPTKSVLDLKTALNAFRKKGMGREEQNCLNQLGMHYYLEGDHVKAENIFKQMLDQINDNPALRSVILGHLVFISACFGKMEVADHYYSQGIALNAEIPNERIQKISRAGLETLHAYRFFFEGKCTSAIKTAGQALKLASELENYRLIGLSHHIISFSYFFMADFERGLEEAKKGLSLLKEKGFQEATYGWLTYCVGVHYFGLKKYTEAMSYFEDALGLFQKMGIRIGQANTYLGLSSVNETLGNISLSEKYIKLCEDVISGIKSPQSEGLVKIWYAMAFMEKGQFKKALQHIQDSEQIVSPFNYTKGLTFFAYGKLYWLQGQKNEAMNKLEVALKIVKEYKLNNLITRQLHWIIPPLVEMYALDKMRPFLETVFSQFGLYTLEDLAELQKNKNSKISSAATRLLSVTPKMPPPKLRILCFGKFRVFLNEEEIPFENWKNKKSLKLLKFLINSRRKGFLSKEMLMELLWPGENPEKTKQRFYVTMSALRKTLEPKIAGKAISSYILREEDSYKLFDSAIETVDIDNFNQAIKRGNNQKDHKKAIMHFKNAETLYKGDFLEDDPYEQWCLDERENLKEQYLHLLISIMDYYENTEDYATCIEYALKYIKKEEYSEYIYQRLMKYYAQTGNHIMVHKIYKKCKAAITEGLDCDIDKKTTKLYRALIV